MAIVQKVNFEPVSDINMVVRRDFQLADPTLADPLNSVALVDGEWMTLDSTGKLVRATDLTTEGNGVTTPLAFPLFAERGRTDIQALAERRMPVLFMGPYEFDTRIFKATAINTGSVGATQSIAITSILQPLKIVTVELGGRKYSGLGGADAAGNDPIVGYVTRLPSANGGKLRFISGWAVRNGTT